MSLKRRKNILFISHDSSLTGAPILLINLLRLLKKKNLFDFKILLKRGGILEKDFMSIAETDILKSKHYASEINLLRRIRNYLLYFWKLKKWSRHINQFDLIFSNTITNGEVLKKINRKHVPVIVYVHELESIINTCAKDAQLSLSFAMKVGVPSEAVSKNLVLNHQVSEKSIFKLNYFFPLVVSNKSKESAKLEMKKRYSIEGEFLVAAMGTATFRKGFDLFLKISDLLKHDQQIVFVWVGDFVDDETKDRFAQFIEKNDMSKKVTITGSMPYSSSNLKPFDLFLLTSREDPYPLVVLEAAFNKLPTLSFDSGGITEFISNDAGWVIPDFSVKAMAEKILELKNTPSIISKAGNAAYEKVKQLHANEETIILQFSQLINEQ